MEHEKGCIAARERYEAWIKQWPNHCKKCYGTGSYYDHGTYWDPPDSGPCGCIEEGKCPRCGKQVEVRNTCVDIFTDEHYFCECGWSDIAVENGEEGMACPLYECFCNYDTRW